jgi:hypothetical protein
MEVAFQHFSTRIKVAMLNEAAATLCMFAESDASRRPFWDDEVCFSHCANFGMVVCCTAMSILSDVPCKYGPPVHMLAWVFFSALIHWRVARK